MSSKNIVSACLLGAWLLLLPTVARSGEDAPTAPRVAGTSRRLPDPSISNDRLRKVGCILGICNVSFKGSMSSSSSSSSSGGPFTEPKVTGGGQIQGDPIFSNLGLLLSPPALVPSPADPTAQASFGFVIQPGSPPTGNLDYKDHPMNVRIKAQRYFSLNVTNGACGPMTHATFGGVASVMRSTGTTTENFFVSADDCGEPGTSDKFGISTFTYSNPPSTLISGNIQIH